LSLGSIFLVVTGGEALYADMGHFGRRPITIGWYAMVLPALLLNYWGQGAFLLASDNPKEAIESVFFRMAPEQLLIPLVLLATCATVIASQALISGVFSLTAQAVQLDYLPRIQIRHTSHSHSGQIYVPLVNWGLMIACIGLVLGFRTSSNLAAAYGIAVTMTMAITTLIFFRVLTDRWNWSRLRAFAICIPLF
jgi:KUP system potassium uptake protein